MNRIFQQVIDARHEADLAADEQLAIWDKLAIQPCHDEIMKWITARDKFRAARDRYLQLLWKSRERFN